MAIAAVLTLAATGMFAADVRRPDLQVRHDAADLKVRPTYSTAPDAPTFVDVAPIVYGNCTTCHRPGQSAPFSLMSYDDVRKRGRTIVDVTSRRYMPPWHASRADGFPEFLDERRLTDAHLDTLTRWVDGGMPLGDASKIPAPPTFPAGWALGEPDLVVTLPRPIAVPAESQDLYRNVTLTVNAPDDRWITAIDYQPSARSVVHHALYFVSPAGVAVGDDEAIPGLGGLARGARAGAAGAGGAGRGRGLLQGRGAQGQAGGALAGAGESSSGLGGWVPGVTPRFYPDGIAQPFPKQSNLILQLHLHPSGKAETENGKIAIYFSKTPPSKSLSGIQVPPVFGFAAGIDIAAGEKRFVIRDSFELPVDVQSYGARGHAHYLAREMKMTAKLPNGKTQGLLWIKDWDFGWQDSYFYKTPFALPKGTKIETEIIYDNSDANPRNPHSPPQAVRWGRGSFDEMGSMTLLIASPPGADGDTLREAQATHFRQQLLRQLMRR